jgi:hypothetical protein
VTKPRVFVSSTFYDLKHVRAGLSEFIQSLGFEPILHERGDIPYLPNVDLDESCRVELQSADIVVLIVGGRYGSPSSAALEAAYRPKIYDSVTRTEFRAAADREFPMWVLIEKSVWHDWENYNANRNRHDFQYAHTEDSQVFLFIDEIRSFRNKSIFQFEYASHIIKYLRNQWAGVFSKLFRDLADQRRLGKIEAQVDRLEAVVTTLTEQLDYLMAHVAGHEDVERVRRERSDLAEKRKIQERLRENAAVEALLGLTRLSFSDLSVSLARFDSPEAAMAAYNVQSALNESQRHLINEHLGEALVLAKQVEAGPSGSNSK